MLEIGNGIIATAAFDVCNILYIETPLKNSGSDREALVLGHRG